MLFLLLVLQYPIESVTMQQRIINRVEGDPHYQQYLQLLEKTWAQGQNGKQGPSRLAVTAMLSVCELFKSAHHFNFRSNVLSMVVRQMNNRHCEQVSDACCQAVEYVFGSPLQFFKATRKNVNL